MLWLLVTLVVFSLISAGCTDGGRSEGSDLKKPCSSSYCYCKRCDMGRWVAIEKSKASNGHIEIKTVGDCAKYCAYYDVYESNKDFKSYRGYDFACNDDLPQMIQPSDCNCMNLRCCKPSAAAPARNMLCLDPNDEDCTYAWVPDSECSNK